MALLAIGTFATISVGQTGTTPAPLLLTGPDYQTPVTDVYGTGAVVYISLTDASLNRDDQRDLVRDVEVKSTTDSTGIKLDLLETGPKTGVFLGAFGVIQGTPATRVAPGVHPFLGKIGYASDPNVNGIGKIPVANGDTITVTGAGKSASVKWRVAADGVFAAADSRGDPIGASSAEIRGYLDSVAVTVTDADLTAAEYTNLVTFFSDGDPAGETITIRRGTGGVYSGSIGFEPSAVANNGKLFVRPNDRVRAVYQESVNSEGLAVSHELPSTGLWTFISSTDGGVFMDQANYFGPSQSQATGFDRARIFVVDADRNEAAAAETETVSVRSTLNPSSVLQLTLTELGGASGFFVTDLKFTTTGTTGGETLRVGPGRDQIIVEYVDVTDNGGLQRERVTHAFWNPVQTASILLGGESPKSVFAGAGPTSIQLEDIDSNRDENLIETVNVQVKSTSDPSGLATVTLTETQQGSGKFVGDLLFSSSSGVGRVRALDGDRVIVEFNDPFTANGKPSIVRSNGASPFGAATTWRAPVGATITTDSAEYFRMGTPTLGSPYATIATIMVTDPDANDPLKRDSITVSAVRSSGTIRTASVTLLEVGVDRGVFVGELRFRDEALTPAPAGVLDVFPASATVQETPFRIEYVEANGPDGNSRLVVSDTKRFFNKAVTGGPVLRAEATVPNMGDAGSHQERLDQLFFDIRPGQNTMLNVVVYSSTAPGSVSLRASSCTATQAKSRALTQDASSPGRYTVSVPVTMAACTATASDPVQAQPTDTITITLGTQTYTVQLRAADPTTNTVSLRDSDLTTVLSRVAGTERPVYVFATGSANTDRATQDLLKVTVQGRNRASPLSLFLVETDVNSGEFVGSFQFLNNADSNAALARVGVNGAVRSLTAPDTAWDLVTVSNDDTSGPATLHGAHRRVEWRPATDGTISVVEDAWGVSGRFVVSLIGDDAASNRIEGESRTVGTTATSSFSANQPILAGTEQVYAGGEVIQTRPSSTDTSPAVAPAGPAERISDRNRDGRVDCGDVSATAMPAIGTIACERVNAATGEIFWTGTCVNPCQAVWSYQYRAKYADPATGIYEYRRGSGSSQIVFGAAIASGRQVVFDYGTTRRTVTAVSGTDIEQVSISLDSLATGNGLPVFTGNIPIETAAGANNGAIVVAGDRTSVSFGFADPAITPDGRPAVASLGNPRSHFVVGTWRAATEATVQFMQPLFGGPSSDPTYGPAVPIQVTDKDSDATSQFDTIVVRARKADNAAEFVDVTLRETGATTGVFRGVAKVSGCSTVLGNDVIEFGNSDCTGSGLLLVQFNDPHVVSGSSALRSATLNWRPAEPGVLTMWLDGATTQPATATATPKGRDGALFLRVKDADANQNAGRFDTVQVRVFSNVEPAGELITLTETGVNNGIFVSSGVRFETSRVANNGRLFAADDGNAVLNLDERITAIYEDPRDDLGNSRVIRPMTGNNIVYTRWDRTFDATTNLELPVYIGHELTTAFAPEAGQVSRAIITVADGDQNRDPRKVENLAIASVSSPLEIGVVNTDGTIIGTSRFQFERLVETGANTGVFAGVFSFAASGTAIPEDLEPTPTMGRVRVANADIIRARYSDAEAGNGAPLAFLSESKWYAKGFGVPSFDLAGYNDLAQGVTIRVVDADIGTATTRDSVGVRVASNAMPSGVSITLQETDVNTRTFAGTVTLTSGTATGSQVKVNNNDLLTVTYQDSEPSGLRTATANVAIGDKTPPVTTLVTDPALPDGRNGAFLRTVNVTFTTSESVSKTEAQVGTTAKQVVSAPIQLGEGVHLVKFQSTDLVGNVEAEKTKTIVVDLTSPTQTVAGLAAASQPGGKVALTWTAVAQLTDPLQFHQYVVFRDGVEAGNSTTPQFEDTVTTEGTVSYRVAVRDLAGRLGPLSTAVTALADKTLPTLGGVTASPLNFDVRKAPTGITVSAAASDANLERVEAKIVDPAGRVLANATLTGSNAGTFSGSVPTANISEACTCDLVVQAIDKAGNIAESKLPMRIRGPDAQAPIVTVSNIAANDEIQLGTAITVQITDNVAISRVTYVLDNREPVTVPIDSTPEDTSFTVPTTGLTLGLHTLVIEVEDNATDENGTATPNRVTRTITFRVVEALSGEPIPTGSLFLTTRAEAQPDGSVKVTWDVPSSLAGIDGFQVWRAASPFVLIANVSDPNARSFTDSSAVAGRVYRYVATAFTNSPFLSLSQVPGYPGNDDAVPGSNPTTAGAEESLPQWLWLVLGAAALIAIAAIVAIPLAARSRRQPEARTSASQQVMVHEPPMEPEAPMAPAPSSLETHRLRCPQCSYRFEVTGSKPIVTNCPNCGRKGILR